MHPPVLRMAAISDIHLGHRRNPAREIIANLRRAFPDNAETAQLDILFIVGDVFDDLLSLSDDEVTEIDLWIVGLLRVCVQHQITVLVLEGTPSHDWKQSKRFATMNEAAQIGCDLTYVKDLSIQYLERFDITVLCIPDEWETTTDKTLTQVRELMKAKGLTQVDYAIMHGQFPHQLPEVARAPVHDAKAYLELVRELIFIGHVHNYSQYERIYAQGSFDRIAHGEEGAKGHLRAAVYDNGRRDVVFVENEGAKRFVTVDCGQLDLEATIAYVDECVAGLPNGSHVRVSAAADNPIFTNMEMLIRRYPLYIWAKHPVAAKEDAKAIVEDEQVYVPITLTRDNLPGLLMERIANSGLPAPVVQAAEQLLKEVA